VCQTGGEVPSKNSRAWTVVEYRPILDLIDPLEYTSAFINSKQLHGSIGFPTIVNTDEVIKEEPATFLVEGGISLKQKS
jgi:hypothetical protein